MPGTVRLGWGDALALVTLFATSIVIAMPVLTGGQLTYIDNPVHLAEIYDLARTDSSGWSEIAFAGFPLHTLHSPLWYGGLVWLVRHGADVIPLYSLAMLLGFAAPSVALYLVARRRTSPIPAGILAYALLVQPSMIWGIGSPLGGMWTHGLANAGLILLSDLYARPRLAPREHFLACLILAVTGLTHLFVLPLVAIVAGLTTLLHSEQTPQWQRELRFRIAGWVVAALASAKYWLTLVLVGSEDAAPHQFFHVADLLVRLLVPSDAMYLLDKRTREGLRFDLWMTDAVPMLVVLGLGIVGAVRARRSRAARGDALSHVGAGLAAILLALLIVDTMVPLRFLGPVTFRQIEGVRLGLALSAVPVLSTLSSFKIPAPQLVPLGLSAAALGITLGSWWGVPLARQNPELVQEELTRTHELWKWLGKNWKAEWGRLYLQDTFGQGWEKGGTAYSHHLVLTAHHTGLPTMGPYYGVIPFRLRWTLSEFNSLYTTRSPHEAWLKEAMEKTNAGILVTSNPLVGAYIGKMDGFKRLAGEGRYEVWRREDAKNEPIAPLSPSNVLTNVRWSRDELELDIEAGYPKARILAKTSYHPWWRIEGAPGAWLRESPEGFLVVDDIPKGKHHLRLYYRPGNLPGWISVFGWGVLAGWGAVTAYLTRRQHAGVSSP